MISVPPLVGNLFSPPFLRFRRHGLAITAALGGGGALWYYYHARSVALARANRKRWEGGRARLSVTISLAPPSPMAVGPFPCPILHSFLSPLPTQHAASGHTSRSDIPPPSAPLPLRLKENKEGNDAAAVVVRPANGGAAGIRARGKGGVKSLQRLLASLRAVGGKHVLGLALLAVARTAMSNRLSHLQGLLFRAAFLRFGRGRAAGGHGGGGSAMFLMRFVPEAAWILLRPRASQREIGKCDAF